MNDDILTKIPDIDYTEEAPVTDYQEFSKVIKSRRSVRVYQDGTVPDQVVEQAIDDALLAPNSSNLQPWMFVRVKSEEKRKKLIRSCLGQSAARTSSELVVALARTHYWPSVQKMMIEKLKENDAPRGAFTYYEKIVPLAYGQGILGLKGLIKAIVIFFRGLSKPTPRGPVNQSDMRVWAHKSTALACENFMLSIRAQGYDTCPMEGFDENLVRDALGAEIWEKGMEVCMIFSVGKRAHNGIYGPQIRMPRENFVRTI